MYVLENNRVKPQYNLALEEYLCRLAGEGREFFMLWRNEPSVIVGRFQDAAAEVNAAFIRGHDIHVVRRNSGGGAVYHDLGNVNYSFVTADRPEYDLAFFAERIVEALSSLGVAAEFGNSRSGAGRNDIAVNGRKISGMAQYRHKGVLLCHGTLLFDCDMEALSQALNVPGEKLARHGVSSARGRVTNLKPLLPNITTCRDFMAALQSALWARIQGVPMVLSGREEAEVRKLMDEKYMSREWNYGGNLNEVV